MARQESDREDLLREATALVERIELVPVDDPTGPHIFVGFRSSGELSIYFGSDRAYHFNTDRELRRAYADGLLYKAEDGKLIALERVRQVGETQLMRHEMTDQSQAEFLADMHEWLRSFVADSGGGKYAIVGQVPPDANVLDHALAEMQKLLAAKVANSPRAH